MKLSQCYHADNLDILWFLWYNRVNRKGWWFYENRVKRWDLLVGEARKVAHDYSPTSIPNSYTKNLEYH